MRRAAPALTALPSPPVASTPVSAYSLGTGGGTRAHLNDKLEEMCARLDKVELVAADTANLAADTADTVNALCDKVDELSTTVEAQERTFSKRLADALAQLTASTLENQSVLAELTAKVQRQEAQLQKLMEEREEAPVQVESSTAVSGAPTRGYLSRAAKAAGLL